MKLTKDNFVWNIIPTNEVADAYSKGEVFILYDDDTEALYTGEEIDENLIYGTELGWLKDITDRQVLTILCIQKYGHLKDITLIWRFVALSDKGLIMIIENKYE